MPARNHQAVSTTMTLGVLHNVDDDGDRWTYLGEVEDNEPHGFGAKLFTGGPSDGDRYTGTFVRGTVVFFIDVFIWLADPLRPDRHARPMCRQFGGVWRAHVPERSYIQWSVC